MSDPTNAAVEPHPFFPHRLHQRSRSRSHSHSKSVYHPTPVPMLTPAPLRHCPDATDNNSVMLRDAAAHDAADPLRAFRAEFCVPRGVYLCGNSLGPMPVRTRPLLAAHVDKWATLGVDAHFAAPQPWVNIECEAAELAMPVVGAAHAHEVAVMNSLTVNLHLMLTAFYQPCDKRRKILLEDHAFSSDEYALQTHVRARLAAAATGKGRAEREGEWKGKNETDTDRDLDKQVDDCLVRMCPRPGEDTLRDDDIIQAIARLDDAGELALVLLPGVQFYTGQFFPLARAAAECTRRDVPLGLDLAHAVGNVPLHLHTWGVDFAVWCHYKYLNSGPGAVAGLFLHDRHAHADLPRLAGWWGHDRASRFDMPQRFAAQRGAEGFQLSNPPVLAILPVIAGLRLLKEAGGVEAVRRKSILLTACLRKWLHALLGSTVDIVTPEDPARCGAQVSIRIRALSERPPGSPTGNTQQAETESGTGERTAETQPQMQAGSVVDAVNAGLARCGVVCDVRRPDVIRVAPAALFNSFTDVYRFVRALHQVLADA